MPACYCDYDAPSFFQERHVRARKVHRCCECGRAIQPGERYQKVIGVWDGRFDQFCRCSHCEAVAAKFNELPCFCDSFRGLYEVINEGYLCDLREAETGDWMAALRLIAAAKRARRENPWRTS